MRISTRIHTYRHKMPNTNTHTLSLSTTSLLEVSTRDVGRGISLREAAPCRVEPTYCANAEPAHQPRSSNAAHGCGVRTPTNALPGSPRYKEC